MSDLVRGTVLLGVPRLISSLGGDPLVHLTEHGIDPASAGNYDRFVRYSSAAAVIGDAALVLDCPDFGLRLARLQNTQILGPGAVIVRNAETVSAALSSICRYVHTVAPADTIEVSRLGDLAVVSFDTDLRRAADRKQMVERALGTTLAAFKIMLGDDFVPIRITFQHRQIGPEDSYRRMFGCPVKFDSELNALHLPAAALSHPIRGRDAAALALAEGYFSGVTPDVALVDHVRRLIRRMLVVGHASLRMVAEALSLHPRVVQRRLAEEGTTFERILDDIRREIAWELSASDLPISRIAAALGYSEQSSYARACRRWHGESPRQLRQRAQLHASERGMHSRSDYVQGAEPSNN
ncbi:AraC family transcriptional regulator [Gordonia insulae]|uniref:HTH-type transcriptional regulator VirS n=1 Tax=Gordonia insulae TaxID=2420509 RepID=A0A3G8JP49_9ACTN|nr:AraC family transcriptional regulator [Gordonia insulae]AZG46239.1 HTH-type transcriptional regulator VirS [Gordonia insulae]